MKEQLVIFGLSGNPSALHHKVIAEVLSMMFDSVIVVPCGPRPEKATTNDIMPINRAVMADLTFSEIPHTTVRLDDLELEAFTRTAALYRQYQADNRDVWIVVGSDLVKKGVDGKSTIEREWADGEQLWYHARFIVIQREGHEVSIRDCPPLSRLLPIDNFLRGTSTHIRELVFSHQEYGHLVVPAVRQYIERHNLYRGVSHNLCSDFTLTDPRIMLVVDEQNAKVPALIEPFKPFVVEKNPNLIVVVGGDGTMLRAIRTEWRKRIPFLGINAGYRGFLMNDPESVSTDFSHMIVRQSPMLYVRSYHAAEGFFENLAFNDVWTRSVNGGQAAHTLVKVDGQIKIPFLISDGVLVSTAAGSTSYAVPMGALPLAIGTEGLLLVGNNVKEPHGWKSTHLSAPSVIDLEVLHNGQRPVEAFIDGVAIGKVTQLHIRQSRIAAPELVFAPSSDLDAKVRNIQFPA